MTGKQDQLEVLGAQTMTYGGATATVWSGLSLNEWGIVVGIVIGVVGLILQGWITINRNRREKQLHRKRMNDMD